MTKNTEKKAYQAPQLIVHGDMTELTQAAKVAPTTLDATYVDGTPIPQLGWNIS